MRTRLGQSAEKQAYFEMPQVCNFLHIRQGNLLVPAPRGGAASFHYRRNVMYPCS